MAPGRRASRWGCLARLHFVGSSGAGSVRLGSRWRCLGVAQYREISFVSTGVGTGARRHSVPSQPGFLVWRCSVHRGGGRVGWFRRALLGCPWRPASARLPPPLRFGGASSYSSWFRPVPNHSDLRLFRKRVYHKICGRVASLFDLRTPAARCPGCRRSRRSRSRRIACRRRWWGRRSPCRRRGREPY